MIRGRSVSTAQPELELKPESMAIMTDRLAELGATDMSIDLEDEDGDCSPSIDGFLQMVNQMNRNIEGIQQKLDEIRRLQENIITANTSKKRYLELTNEIKQISLTVHKGLKRLDEEIKRDDSGPNRHNAEFRIKKIQAGALRQNLKRLVLEYKQLEEQHKENCKVVLRRQLQISYPSHHVLDDELEELMIEIESRGFEAVLTERFPLTALGSGTAKTTQKRQALEEVEERKILQLEENVKELHDMIVLLNDESQDESDLADNIQHHIENTKDYVPKVTKQASIARLYQEKNSLKELYVELLQ